MTVEASQVPHGPSDEPMCGCCGRRLPRTSLTELGRTPGTFICGGCARWAGRRLLTRTALRLPPILRSAWSWVGARRRARAGMSAAIPILQVSDLHRTEAFYRQLGLQATFHHADYLIMRSGPVEFHFGREPAPAPVSCYVDTDDAARVWKEFHAQGVEGLGEVEDFDYGMREFVLTDPDGNRLRIGSPIP